ncbi:hypothetical protein [Paenibacillus bovis]|uniref:Uncharacterized protein n=1 Tax=Paenibacillus bovis TaxID=1616788 RepID=A0A172ZHK5_9BACL|nr:hypothetical protein [Paenibacillus bovis]ANF96630.1 hypothetical protein AR543_11840 [Paenibacillus bovis]
MDSIRLEQIIEAIEKGKMRGYDEIVTGSPADKDLSSKDLSGEPANLIQYALQKKGDVYVAYFFMIAVDRMHLYEDEAIEQSVSFPERNQAIDFLIARGAKIERFAPFRGQRPFS